MRRFDDRPKQRASVGSVEEEATTGLARALSKLGYCSRSEGWRLVQEGRVSVNGRVERNPERRVWWRRDQIEVNGLQVEREKLVYLMLNKPRGLVTTTADEHGRDTVYRCLDGTWSGHPGAGESRAGSVPMRPKHSATPLRIFPVGRLDKASEGLLLFTNDTAWSAAVTDPGRGVEKVYHVQINALADAVLLGRLLAGVSSDGELLGAARAEVLRRGDKNSWLAVTLLEGRNRHLRRMMEGLGLEVLRLVRVSIGGLALGSLAKGAHRMLSESEVRMLANPVVPTAHGGPLPADTSNRRGQR